MQRMITLTTCPKDCTPISPETLTWCFQACLESFLTDNKLHVTQKQMVEEGKAKGLCKDTGVVGSSDEMKKFCSAFHIDFEEIEYQKIPQKIESGEGVLIGPWAYKGDPKGQHCVRFCRRIDDQKFLVMNPKFPTAVCEEWSIETIAAWQCGVFKIRLVGA